MSFRLLMAMLVCTAALPAATTTITGDPSCYSQTMGPIQSNYGLQFVTGVAAPYSMEPKNLWCSIQVDFTFYTSPEPLEGETFLKIRMLRDSSHGVPYFSEQIIPYILGTEYHLSLVESYQQWVIYTRSSGSSIFASAFRRVSSPYSIATYDISIPLYEGERPIAPSEEPNPTVPEPSTLWLAGGALLAYLPNRRRKR